MNEQKRLPSGGEFSPGQIELRSALTIVAAAASVKEAIEGLRERYFANSCPQYEGAARLHQQSKRANNVLIGMRTYGLLDGNKLSDVGKRILGASGASSYKELAIHILNELNGRELLDAIRTLQLRQVPVTKDSLAYELRQRGFSVPRATTHHLVMIKWLREAGVFTGQRGYEVDDTTLRELLGLSSHEILKALDVTKTQRDFLRAAIALAETPEETIRVGNALDYAQSVFGTHFRDDQIYRTVIQPLEEQGWLTAQRGTKGRGAKSGSVQLTIEAFSAFGSPAASALSHDASRLRELRRVPLADILSRLDSQNTHDKGLALEHLALRFCEYLNLRFKNWRLRSSDTGGAEVDVIAESDRLVFSRWQVQCKNTRTTDLADAAKEVGLAVAIHSQIIVLITTGKITATAKQYAETIAASSPYQFVMLDGSALKKISSSESPGNALIDFLNETASRTLQLKSDQIDEAGKSGEV